MWGDRREAVFVECVVFSVVVTVCSINYMYIDLQLGSTAAPLWSWCAGQRESQPQSGLAAVAVPERELMTILCFVLKSIRVYNWCEYHGSVGLPRSVLSRCYCVVTAAGLRSVGFLAPLMHARNLPHSNFAASHVLNEFLHFWIHNQKITKD